MHCAYCGQKTGQKHAEGCPDEKVTSSVEWSRRLEEFESGRDDAEVGNRPRSRRPAYRLGFHSTP